MIKFFEAISYQPLFNALIFLVWALPGNQVGWAIIILTLVIRIALLPVTVHTARVQARMRLLQPKIDELRKQHKDDKTLQSQAMMQLYKEEGVSPFSSCLPLIIQLIVLIVLYNVFRNGLTTEHFDALYSFTPRPNELNTHFFGVDLGKPDKLILPLLAGLTQFWQTKITIMPTSGNSNDPMAAFSKQMVYLAPVMTFVFARGFPAALPLYWIITNLFTVAQQEYVLKRQGLVPSKTPSVITNIVKQDAKASVSKSQPAHEETSERKKSGVTVTVRKRS